MISRKYYLIGLSFLVLFFVSGCSDNTFLIKKSTNILPSQNGTFYDPSKSFELQSFCTSTSFVSNASVDSLNCSSGFLTDLKFNGSLWIAMCCNYDSTKCFSSNVSNILNYTGLGLTADHIISSEFITDGYYVTCCNLEGSMCYVPVQQNFSGCGVGYSEMVSHVHFDNSTKQWGVVSCLNGIN